MYRLITSKSLCVLAIICALMAANFADGRASEKRHNSAEPRSEVFTKCWDYSSLPDLSKLPAADDRGVYFLNADNRLEAADLKNAVKLWSTELGGEVISNIFAFENALLVVSSSEQFADGRPGRAILRSLSKQTGIANWSTPLPNMSRATLGALDGKLVVVDSSGRIGAFRYADGAEVWQIDLGTHITSEPYFGAVELTVATEKKDVVVVSGNGGRRLLVSKTDHLPTAVLRDASNRLLVGDDRGNVILMSSDGKRSWRFKNGARISFLLSYDSEFLAASFDNFIYKLSRGGNVEWKRRLSGRVAEKPLIIGDTAIVSIVGDSSIYFIDLKNGKISNRIETGDADVSGTATSAGRYSLVVGGTRGLTLYSREKCPIK